MYSALLEWLPNPLSPNPSRTGARVFADANEASLPLPSPRAPHRLRPITSVLPDVPADGAAVRPSVPQGQALAARRLWTATKRDQDVLPLTFAPPSDAPVLQACDHSTSPACQGSQSRSLQPGRLGLGFSRQPEGMPALLGTHAPTGARLQRAKIACGKREAQGVTLTHGSVVLRDTSPLDDGSDAPDWRP